LLGRGAAFVGRQIVTQRAAHGEIFHDKCVLESRWNSNSSRSSPAEPDQRPALRETGVGATIRLQVGLADSFTVNVNGKWVHVLVCVPNRGSTVSREIRVAAEPLDRRRNGRLGRIEFVDYAVRVIVKEYEPSLF
jgi:hypothetical protein